MSKSYEDEINTELSRRHRQAKRMRTEREEWKELGYHLRRVVILFLGSFLLVVLVAIVFVLTEGRL
jgi:hypothetical protein